MLKCIYTAACLFYFVCHELACFFYFCKPYHLREHLAERFYCTVEVNGRKSRAIRKNVIAVRCLVLRLEYRDIHAHDVLFFNIKLHFLLRQHQGCLKHLALHDRTGNCHVFVDASAKLDMAVSIADNAKTQRPSVCNAIETLLVHREIAEAFLPAVKAAFDKHSVVIHGDETVQRILGDCVIPVTEEDYYKEYGDYEIAVHIVDSVEEACAHIRQYSTHHSEAIVTESMENAEYFLNHLDSAALYVNASTRFTDGEEFGFGAEIGISTQKLHARGPMGLPALTTTQYRITGNGQTRG